MKTVKILLLAPFLLLFLSCEEKATGPVGGGSIIGNWLESNAIVSLLLTTKSNQTAKNFLNSTGEISITGDYKTKLNLMIYVTIENENTGIDSTGFIITNIMGMLGFSDTSFTMVINPDGEGRITISANDDTEFTSTLTNPVNFTFNDDKTLNITNTTLVNANDNTSISLSGSITLEEVNIPANTPTMLNSNAPQYYEFGNTVTTFFEDSTFTSSEDTGIGDSTGTWQVVGDTLKLTTSQEVEDFYTDEITIVDTIWAFNYVNYGNQFILSQTLDICEGLPATSEDEDELTCQTIFNLIETFTHVDSNSINKAELIYQLFFEKIPDNQATKISNSSESLLTKSLPKDILQYLNKNKQLFR
jgi:hypothetical protein